MSTNVTLPALGESVNEGTVSRWLKNVGDTVAADEALVEVSTDKVDTEVPAPVAGTILEIRVPEDETVEVGGILCVIGEANEAGAEPEQPAEPEAPATEAPAAEQPAAEAPAAAPAAGAASGTEVTLPALGESVNEGTISRWLKQVGDTVAADEALVEVSTDKVDTEVPAPVAGTVLEIRVNEDETAPVGAVLAIIGDPNAAAAPAEQAPAAPAQEKADEEAEAAVVPSPAVADAKPATAEAPAPAAGAAAGTEVTLPALGESVNEGTISRWLKQVGDKVEVDEPIVEVSTDKVDTEVPSPVSGTILEILVNEDETAPVGGVLAIIGDAFAAAAPAAEQAPAAPAQEEPEAKRAAESTAPKEAAVARRAEAAPADDLYVTPLVRKMAAEHGVDLGTLVGTGVGGRIRKQDVLAAAGKGETPAAQPAAAPAAPKPAATPAAQAPAPAAPAAKPAPAAAAPKPAAAPAKAEAPAEDKRGKTEKLSRMRQVIAERMTESLQTSAQLTATVEVDFTRISKLRSQVKADFKARNGVGLSYLPFITKAVLEQLRVMPVFNATMNLAEKTVTYNDVENIGIAVDTPRGLLVPVIREAGDLNITGLAKKIADVAARTRDNQISPDELSGGTFTITNYGSAGALMDTPIINMPQVAILGTGALVRRPMVIDDGFGETIAVRDMMYLSMTYDHRLIDGAVAARFLSAVKARLEEGKFESELGL